MGSPSHSWHRRCWTLSITSLASRFSSQRRPLVTAPDARSMSMNERSTASVVVAASSKAWALVISPMAAFTFVDKAK